VLDGAFCRLERLDASVHGDALFEASSVNDAANRFRYLPQPAPSTRGEFDAWCVPAQESSDPLWYAVIDKRTGRAEGRQSLMRIDPTHRSIEIGGIYWGPSIAGTAVATEANFLFAQYAFDELGYRRYEWKCDALNAPSIRAALRFGFTYEGQFRRAVIVRGRSRDTAWFSMIEEEWPRIRAAYLAWLSPENFDAEGRQRTRLAAVITPG
jgi:RimJ/RimL family protein N-acetyltransferase